MELRKNIFVFNLKPVKKVLEVPPWPNTAFPHANFLNVGFTKELHPHHSEDEDDDTEDEGEIGERSNSVLHDGQDVIERLPGLGQLEHSQQPEGPQHGQTLDTIC